MDSDLEASIRPAIREFLGAPPETCLTFAVTGDEDRWIQLMGDLLNAAYPHPKAPADTMAALLSSSLIESLTCFEAGKYVTLTVRDRSDEALAEWVEEYFVSVLGCTRGQVEVDFWFEQL